MDLAATHQAVQFDGVPFLARLALRLASQIRHGTVHVRLPDQRTVTLRGRLPGPSATIELNNYRFARSLVMGGDIGMAEAYIRGDWSTPDLTQLLYVFCLNEELVDSAFAGNMLVRLCRRVLHRLRRNTRQGSRHNIHSHYDLGNEFFAAWLDSSMTYSSALFPAETADLPAAQQHKYEQLAKAIELRPGQSVLEIGCGWGGFAEFAAKLTAPAWWHSPSARSSTNLPVDESTKPGSAKRSRSGCRIIATRKVISTASPPSR